MLPPQEIYYKKQYTKFYVSKQKNKQQLYFLINCKIDVFEDAEKKVDFSMDVEISYLLLIKNNKCFTTLRQSNHWDLKSSISDKTCNLRDCIKIQPEFRSFGIGGFVLKEMLSIASEYIPDYSLTADLSPVDEEEEENHIRRDALYSRLGFDFLDKDVDNNKFIQKEIYIDKLSNLNFDKRYDFIEEIGPYKIADVIYKMSENIYQLRTQNKSYKYTYNYYRNLCLKQMGILVKYHISATTIIAIIGLTIYFKYFY